MAFLQAAFNPLNGEIILLQQWETNKLNAGMLRYLQLNPQTL
jgi:hypothetical protein